MGYICPEYPGFFEPGHCAELSNTRNAVVHGDAYAHFTGQLKIVDSSIQRKKFWARDRHGQRKKLVARQEVLLLNSLDVLEMALIVLRDRPRRDRITMRKNRANTGIFQALYRRVGAGTDFRYNDKWDDDPNDPGLGEIVSAELAPCLVGIEGPMHLCEDLRIRHRQRRPVHLRGIYLRI
jgi:hypothetical protein